MAMLRRACSAKVTSLFLVVGSAAALAAGAKEPAPSPLCEAVDPRGARCTLATPFHGAWIVTACEHPDGGVTLTGDLSPDGSKEQQRVVTYARAPLSSIGAALASGAASPDDLAAPYTDADLLKLEVKGPGVEGKRELLLPNPSAASRPPTLACEAMFKEARIAAPVAVWSKPKVPGRAEVLATTERALLKLMEARTEPALLAVVAKERPGVLELTGIVRRTGGAEQVAMNGLAAFVQDALGEGIQVKDSILILEKTSALPQGDLVVLIKK